MTNQGIRMWKKYPYRQINILQEQVSLQWSIEVLFNVPRNGAIVFGTRHIDYHNSNQRRKAYHIQCIAVECH